MLHARQALGGWATFPTRSAFWSFLSHSTGLPLRSSLRADSPNPVRKMIPPTWKTVNVACQGPVALTLTTGNAGGLVSCELLVTTIPELSGCFT